VTITRTLGLRPQLDALPEDVVEALIRLVRDTRFGSIELVVHEGRVTQIERRERLRFPAAAQPK